MATGTRFALLLVLAMAFLGREAAADGATNPKEVKAPAIRLDLRSPDDRARVLGAVKSDSSSMPATTAEGLPGWMATVPDSMRAIVKATDKVAYVRVFADKVGNSIALSIVGPSGPVRRATLPPTPSVTRTWTWDVRDSVKVRVPPGIYEFRVSSPEAHVIGYMVVQK